MARCARCGEDRADGAREDLPLCPDCEHTVACEVDRDRLARRLADLRAAVSAYLAALDAWVSAESALLVDQRPLARDECLEQRRRLDRARHALLAAAGGDGTAT